MADGLDHGILNTVLDSLEVGVLILDADGHIVHCNRWLARRGGLAAESADGRPFGEVFPAALGTRLEQAVLHALRDGLPSLLSPALHGTLLPLYQTPDDRRRERRMQQLIHVMPLRDEPGRVACLIQISDMTANISRERLLRQQTEALRRTTTQDSLTGLINRRRFDEVLASEFRKAQSQQRHLGLIIADIDGFNAYNAQYGNELGDACLVRVAGALQDAIRPIGDLVARYDRDKFALILPGIEEKEICRYVENLRLRIQTLDIAHETSSVAGGRLTISLGATALLPGTGADTHTLLSSADVALFQAKHEGRNRALLFSPEDGSFRHCS